MTTFFAWFFKKVIVEFLWDKAVSGLNRLVSWIKEVSERKKIVEENDTQAAVVESVADEIKRLLKAGEVVPEELYEKLKVETRKLAYRSDVNP